jgi:hemerythrin
MTVTYSDLNASQREIVDQLNNLKCGANGKSLSSSEVSCVQSLFREYCLIEEKLMVSVDYPFIHAHILAHTIVGKYFLRLVLEKDLYLASDLIADILEHIDTYDAQFNEFLIINRKS